MNDKAERAQVRRLLWRWGKATSFCARRQREIEKYQDLIEGVTYLKPQELSGMPHGSGTSDTTAWTAVQLDELKRRYNERISELRQDVTRELDFAAVFDQIMDVLEPMETTVIEYKYKHERSPRNIAMLLSYCERQVERIEEKAVDKLRENIEIVVMPQ